MDIDVDHEEVVGQNNGNEGSNEEQILSKVQVEEKLISFVYSNPHLYTKTSNAYHDGQLIQNSWQEFAKQINSTATFAKDLWSTLKQQHNAYLKKLHSALTTGAGKNNEDDAPIRLPGFRHSKTMEFMKDNYVPRKKRTTTFTLNKTTSSQQTISGQSSSQASGSILNSSENSEPCTAETTENFADDGMNLGRSTDSTNGNAGSSQNSSHVTSKLTPESQTPGAALLAKEEHDRKKRRTNKRKTSSEPDEFESQLLETLDSLNHPHIDKPDEPNLFASSLVPAFKRVCDWDALRFSELKLDIQSLVLQAERDAKNIDYLRS